MDSLQRTTSLQQLPKTAGFAQNNSQTPGILLSPASSRSCGFFARMFPISQGFPTLMYLHASICRGGCRSSCCPRPHLNQNPTSALCFNSSCILPRKVSCPFSLTSRAVLGKDQAGVMVWDKDASVSTALASSRSGNHYPPWTGASPAALTAHFFLGHPTNHATSEAHQPLSLQSEGPHIPDFPLVLPFSGFPPVNVPSSEHCFTIQSSHFQPSPPCSSVWGRTTLTPHSHTLIYPLSEETTDIEKINQRQRAN